jgi:hypothetical protein
MIACWRPRPAIAKLSITVEDAVFVAFNEASRCQSVVGMDWDGFLLYIGKIGGRMAETWNKRERERKNRQKKQEKLEKKQDRKQGKGQQDWTAMLAYVDENGDLTNKKPA